jgi:tetratricopeptide (TPR) repeat protein
MVPGPILLQLRELLQDRRIGDGLALLEQHRGAFAQITPQDPFAGLAVGCLAQWVDVGFDDAGLLAQLLQAFPKTTRQTLRLADYIHLRMAEGELAMRREDLDEALRHLDAVLTICDEVEDRKIAAIAIFWKARCLRKAGEYDQALEITRRGIAIASELGLPYVAAVIRTVESWLLFQKGDTKHALAILAEAESALRNTDDLITLGNIQSSYGRIALREGRYDHAQKFFEASIELFKRRPILEGYLARSLTNIAQAKRLLALQLRRSIDARWERQRSGKGGERQTEKQNKAGQLERMHALLRNAEADLMRANAIYKRDQNHHGAGNVNVGLAQIYLDLGDLDEAEERASEAFELGNAKEDYVLMCRARMVEAMVANARFEEQIGEGEYPSRFGQVAHDCAKEALDLAERTESGRLLAEAQICLGATLVNGFFHDTELARQCCHRAEAYLDQDRHDPLWLEMERLREKISHAGQEEPNLRAWSQGTIGAKSLQDVVGEFEELLIRRVWEQEGERVVRVAHRLAVSPKKVRRTLRRLGLLPTQAVN